MYKCVYKYIYINIYITTGIYKYIYLHFINIKFKVIGGAYFIYFWQGKVCVRNTAAMISNLFFYSEVVTSTRYGTSCISRV